MSAQHSAWRLYPWAVVAAMAVVVVVNGGMVWSSLATFPGIAASDAFDHSNHYDDVLAVARRQAALGWHLQAGEDAGRAVLTLADRDGQPLSGAQIVATARRPLGADQATPLSFREVAPGRYMADATLPAVGQWDLLLAVSHGSDSLHATPRLVVR